MSPIQGILFFLCRGGKPAIQVPNLSGERLGYVGFLPTKNPHGGLPPCIFGRLRDLQWNTTGAPLAQCPKAHPGTGIITCPSTLLVRNNIVTTPCRCPPRGRYLDVVAPATNAHDPDDPLSSPLTTGGGDRSRILTGATRLASLD